MSQHMFGLKKTNMKREAHTETKQMKNQQGQTKQIFRPLAEYLKMTYGKKCWDGRYFSPKPACQSGTVGYTRVRGKMCECDTS